MKGPGEELMLSFLKGAGKKDENIKETQSKGKSAAEGRGLGMGQGEGRSAGRK